MVLHDCKNRQDKGNFAFKIQNMVTMLWKCWPCILLTGYCTLYSLYANSSRCKDIPSMKVDKNYANGKLYSGKCDEERNSDLNISS